MVAHPSGKTLIVARNESSQLDLFEVQVAGGAERRIPLDHSSPLFGLFISPGTISADGQMLVSVNLVDSSWRSSTCKRDALHVWRAPARATCIRPRGPPTAGSSPAVSLWLRRSGSSRRRGSKSTRHFSSSPRGP